MKMLTSIFLALFSLVLFATAQERKISGRVTDENGNPLASVSVSVKNGANHNAALAVTMNMSAGANDWQYVIPQAEINANPLVTQNP